LEAGWVFPGGISILRVGYITAFLLMHTCASNKYLFDFHCTLVSDDPHHFLFLQRKRKQKNSLSPD
jgi:hypothetical protein